MIVPNTARKTVLADRAAIISMEPVVLAMTGARGLVLPLGTTTLHAFLPNLFRRVTLTALHSLPWARRWGSWCRTSSSTNDCDRLMPFLFGGDHRDGNLAAIS